MLWLLFFFLFILKYFLIGIKMIRWPNQGNNAYYILPILNFNHIQKHTQQQISIDSTNFVRFNNTKIWTSIQRYLRNIDILTTIDFDNECVINVWNFLWSARTNFSNWNQMNHETFKITNCYVLNVKTSISLIRIELKHTTIEWNKRTYEKKNDYWCVFHDLNDFVRVLIGDLKHICQS